MPSGGQILAVKGDSEVRAREIAPHRFFFMANEDKGPGAKACATPD